MHNAPSALILIALAAVPASAQSSAGATDARRLIDEAAQCRALSDGPARLACFDRTVGRIVTARDAGEITILDRERVRATNRSLFGFNLPKLNLFGDRDDDARAETEIVKQVDSTIRQVAGAGPGLYILRLDNGSQWRLTETATFAPRPGEAIRIRRGTLSSYRASIANGRPIGIVRDR